MRASEIRELTDEELAHTRDAEDLLDDDRSGQDGSNGRPEVGHDRQHRGFQRMVANDRCLAESLRAGSADEIAVQYIDEARAGQSRDIGNLR